MKCFRISTLNALQVSCLLSLITVQRFVAIAIEPKFLFGVSHRRTREARKRVIEEERVVVKEEEEEVEVDFSSDTTSSKLA